MELDAWSDFLVITGGSAAALVGLMFVVISLGPETGARSKESVRAFISPVVGFFASVLVITAVMAMPGLPLSLRGGAVAALGLAGVGYLIFARAWKQVRPHNLGVEDLVCYFVLPLCAYGATLGGGIALALRHPMGTTFVGGAIVALLAVGLRNAWDLVIFIARKKADDADAAATTRPG